MRKPVWMITTVMPLSLAQFLYLFSRKGAANMSVIYYRIAENKGSYWDWVILPVTSLQQVYTFLHYNTAGMDLDKVVVVGSQESAKLTYYLKNYIFGEGPCVVCPARDILARRQWNVELEEKRLESWVLKEAEQYLERVQKYPNVEHDEQKINKRLEFLHYLVKRGDFSEDMFIKAPETP